MIINNWRGYNVTIKHRSDKYCKLELFNNNIINISKRVYSANPNGLEVEEINNNIYESIKKESVQMTLLNAIILLGLILITFGCVFYVIAMLMERYYDRKLWELNQRLRRDDKWRDKQ
jgi:hypothetical protein